MVNKLLYWIPRILSILFILFLAMFSLDVFDNCFGLDCLLGLLIHNIPVFILIIALIFSWKHEWLGGIIFILGGLLYVLMIAINFIMNLGSAEPMPWYMLSWILTIAVPAFVIGYLWILNWKARKKKK